MQTIIHIGQHKTGTTSIQNFLISNKEPLEEKGIYIPSKIFDNGSPSHYLLNVYSLSKTRFSSMKDAVIVERGEKYIEWLDEHLPSEIEKIYEVAKLKNCNQIIWSNEGLYLLNSETEYQKLKTLFDSYSSEVLVVCCFREKKSFRKSYSDQLARQQITPIKDKTSYRYIAKNSWLFDYDRKKHLLEIVFDKCCFFSYDPVNNTKAFFDALGIPISEHTEQRHNESPKRKNIRGLFT
jgi:hypothetical protein